MKTFFKFSVLLLFIGFYSCDKEAVTEEGILEKNKSFYDQITFNEIEYRRETRMQWVSFLIAQSILSSESAEEFFTNVLANSSQTNIITIRSLLGRNITDNAFKEAFKSEFLFYASGVGCRHTDDPDGVPTNTNKPPPAFIGVDEMSHEDLYIYSTLNDIEEYEFELYLPNGYSGSSDGNQITSSAYSLGISIENVQGYIHKGRCDTDSVSVIAPTYEGNLIILQYRD